MFLSAIDGAESMPSLTLAIPIYNGGDRLAGLWSALERLNVPVGFVWRIILVDNNSQDTSLDQMRQWAQTWRRCPVQVVQEREQGAAFARWQAVRCSPDDWLAFLDDDNWPEPDWLVAIAAFIDTLPIDSPIAAFAGRVLPNYHTAPPAGFSRIEGYLAVRSYPDLGDRPCAFAAAQLRLPPAAALVVRRQAWLGAVPARPRLGGKVPGRLIQGDDYEPLLYLVKAGWQIWFVPSLVTHHQIPASRLEPAALVQLARGCGLATYTLRSILEPAGVGLALRTIVGGLRRSLRLLVRHGGQIRRDPVLAAEWAFEIGVILSPFI